MRAAVQLEPQEGDTRVEQPAAFAFFEFAPERNLARHAVREPLETDQAG